MEHPDLVTGAVLTVMTLVVLVGGIKSIGRVTAGFVPIMIVFYVLGGLYILLANSARCPPPSRRSSRMRSRAPPPPAASRVRC